MKIMEVESIDSTNDYLLAHLHDLPSHTILRADYQTRGHGRRDHQWDSQSGENLLFSILIKDKIRPYEVSMVALYSIMEMMKHHGIQAYVKFPNDLYVNDDKICGILTQTIYEGTIQGIVIGIGLNIHDHDHMAMDQLVDEKLDVHDVMMEILNIFFKSLTINFSIIIDAINQRSYLKGKIIDYKDYGPVSFLSIDEDGYVFMKTKRGLYKYPVNEIQIGKVASN